MITDDDLNLALDRIARTPDGELLYRYFQKVLMGVLTDVDPGRSALRTNHGRRSLAAELMGRMAKGIDESAGRSSDDTSDTGKRTERPVVFVARQPARIAGSESAREFIRRTDPELAAIAGRNAKPDDAA